MTPDAVGRGERERKPAAWLVRNDWGVRLFLTQGAAERCANEASVEECTTSVQPLYAALPPDAGGEDGERCRANEEFAAQQYRKECDLMHQYVRMHNVGGAAGYGKNVFGLVRDECDRLRAALRSATERSGGGS